MLVADIGGIKALFLNDCVVDDEVEAAALRRVLDQPIDVLFTQFSYAAWAGNPNEVELRRKAAADKLAAIEAQVRVLQPTWVVPYASFVWFCHEENFFNNDSMNNLQAACDAVASGRRANRAAARSWLVAEGQPAVR